MDFFLKCFYSRNTQEILQLETLFENYEEVRKLLENGADPNKFAWDNENALQRAVEKNSLKMAKLLVRFGADGSLFSSSKNGYAQSAISKSALQDNKEMFDYLMFKCNRNTLTFLDTACLCTILYRGELHFIKPYIVFGHDVTKRISASMAIRNIEIFKFFISLGVEVPGSFPASTDFELFVKEERKYSQLTTTEREQLAEQTKKSLRNEVANNMLKFAQEEVLDICIALKSADIPLYVMKEIVGWLPNYDIFTDFQIVRLLEKIYKSTRKIKQNLTG